MFGVRVAQIAPLNPHRFAHAQPGVVDQAQHGAITRELHGPEQGGDLFASEHQRQGLRRRNAEFLEHRPGQAQLEVLAP
ncbi:MAG TPA: hypothetical protein VNN22_11855 [Verrucomicrobiae bacterium]|nr:hypothetical protein [Verrucomicrobiae bacterium]